MKNWYTPRAQITRFLAADYIAACGDTASVVLFDCNAGDAEQRYDVVTEDGHLLTKDTAIRTQFYHPCRAVHEADTDDEFVRGFMYASNGKDMRISASAKQDVMIWIDEEKDVHCTTNLDRNTWQVSKS